MGCSEAAKVEWQEVVTVLNSDVTRGLTEDDVEARRRTVGYNQFTEPQEDPIWKKFLGQVGGVCLMSVLCLAGVSVASNIWPDITGAVWQLRLL